MLGTPSLLLIIDQVVSACVAPHADTRCAVSERGRESRERESGGVCQRADELIYCWVFGLLSQ